MRPTVRPMLPEDEPFLWTALYHALHVPPGAEPPPFETVRQPDLRRYVVGWMEEPDDLGVLAELDGDPIGAAWIRRWSRSDHGYGFVDEATPELSISVLPGHRGRGLGTAMLSALLEMAAMRFPAVSLSVSTSNPAVRLYRRFGFRTAGEPDTHSLTMVKRFRKAGEPV